MADKDYTDVIEQLKRDKNNLTNQQKDIFRRMNDFQRQATMIEGAKFFIDQFMKRFNEPEQGKK